MDILANVQRILDIINRPNQDADTKAAAIELLKIMGEIDGVDYIE